MSVFGFKKPSSKELGWAEHRHSIQIEINRKLYMNEQTLDLDQAGYLRLTTDLKALVEQLMATDPRTL
jgi:N-formylglutamate deformylase